MRFTLRNVFLAAASMAAATLAINSAMAGTVNIPFNFTVADKTCPAGVYSVQQDSLGNVVTLQSKDASQAFTWTLAPGDPAPTDARVILKFSETGQAHALQSVQFGPRVTSRLDMHPDSNEPAPTRIAGQ